MEGGPASAFAPPGLGRVTDSGAEGGGRAGMLNCRPFHCCWWACGGRDGEASWCWGLGFWWKYVLVVVVAVVAAKNQG